jgi:hypothetical protein
VSLITVNNIIVKKVSLKVSLIASKCHRLSLSLITVNEPPVMVKPYFHFRRVVFSSQFKSSVDNILVKVAVLRIPFDLDGSTITSNSHTHPSYSQTSRLLTSSLSLVVPVPRSTQCMGDV